MMTHLATVPDQTHDQYYPLYKANALIIRAKLARIRGDLRAWEDLGTLALAAIEEVRPEMRTSLRERFWRGVER